ncbi:patatin-like phospholipase family protein [Denitratisoma oestradiolicum]|uniref:Patatin n=1 Tax=Denitratisoma oestradiolicum TaxID=311182 RepID=A0A6S6Y0Y2_9PROT|nr:patatin-like phospholipase family protein [Denitratisoma oestradiolicum]TWO81955.1 esterase [Denitratisoma oestradiolicum]CAB1368859.1 Patatin [Denitratisoma oestradiolicum]
MPSINFLSALLLATFLSACSALIEKPAPVASAPAPVAVAPMKIALVLGGGAARGFAHVGVIKVLEAQGIIPDLVVGTSAGSVVGALYAAGRSGFDLQKIAQEMDEGQIGDWSLPDRGVLKGEALQTFINRAVDNRPLEKLAKPFAAVVTDLGNGEMVVFQTGNTGMAVRASSTVPGVFQPVRINGREYVDGGLVSPVPVRVARSLGANFVIAVDISSKPQDHRTQSTLDVLLQTVTIMGQSISRHELKEADVVIRPVTADLPSADFQGRHRAILEGERAATAAMPEIKARLARAR